MESIFHSRKVTMEPDAKRAIADRNENLVPESKKPKYTFVMATSANLETTTYARRMLDNWG